MTENIVQAETFKYGQTVYHYTDLQCEQPYKVLESNTLSTKILYDNGVVGYAMTDLLWRG